MILGDFEDGKWQPMEGGCLGSEILAGEWLKNTTLGVGGPATHGQREGGEKKREKVTCIFA